MSSRGKSSQITSKSIALKKLNNESPIEVFHHVDGVEIILAALEDVVDVSESLNCVLELFRKTGDSTLSKAVSVLDPMVEKLSIVVSSEFPNLDLIRRDLIKRGFADKIQGGVRYDRLQARLEGGSYE